MSAAEDIVADEIAGEQSVESMLDGLAAAGKFEPGQFYDDIPNPLYHAGPGCSSSNLKQVAQSPAHYWTLKHHPKPSTPTMILGTQLHCLVLEPDVFAQTYVLEPSDAPRRPTRAQMNAKKPSPESLHAIAYWREFDVENEGKQIIDNKPGEDPFWSPGDWDRLHRIRDSILAHPIASCFLQHFIPERSMYWHERIAVRLPGGEIEINELAKARFDGIDLMHNIGFDLKTAADASYSGFTRAVVDFGYHISRQWYMRGQAATGHALQEFVFIVAEKEPPYAVGVYTVDQRFQSLADSLIRVYLETYSRCRELNEWPAYPIDVRELQTPRYAEFISIS